DRVDDVLRRQLPPVDGGLRVPPQATSELKNVRRLGRLGPRLGQVTLERQRARLHLPPRLVLEEPAAGEGQRDMDLVRDAARAVKVEVRGIPRLERQRAAPLGRLPAGERR